MTLDEAAEKAQRHIDTLIAIYGRLPPTQGSGDMLAYDLARALLAVLPVVRAAEAWADTNAESDTAETYQLVDAIISMRRNLGGS